MTSLPNHVRNVILIDFDGVLNMPRHPEDLERRLIAEGKTPALRDEFPWVKTGPKDLEKFTFEGIGGAPVWGMVRTTVINELRRLTEAKADRIVWATSWLTEPDRLRAVASQSGMAFIEFPDLGDIVPMNVPLERWANHWKTALVFRHVDAGARVLWIDDQLERRPTRAHLNYLDVIAPSLFFGLTPAHLHLIQRWLEGEKLAVFDNHAFDSWNGADEHR